MTAQTFEGFLLTRNWRDTPAGIELEFWFSTAQGPLCALVRGEHSVFFLPQRDVPAARTVLGAMPGLDIRPVKLRNFSMEPVVGLYFSQYRAARRAADQLRASGSVLSPGRRVCRAQRAAVDNSCCWRIQPSRPEPTYPR